MGWERGSRLPDLSLPGLGPESPITVLKQKVKFFIRPFRRHDSSAQYTGAIGEKFTQFLYATEYSFLKETLESMV